MAPQTQTRGIRCLSCTAGKIEEWVAGHVSGWKPCAVCGGTGAMLAPQPMPRPDEGAERIAA